MSMAEIYWNRSKARATCRVCYNSTLTSSQLEKTMGAKCPSLFLISIGYKNFIDTLAISVSNTAR